MPIAVTCTDCDKKLKVKEDAAGKKVRCPGCSSVIQVPKSGEPELDELEDFDEEDDFVARKPRRKRGKQAVDELEDFDELEDDLPTIRKPKKGDKKAKAKPRRASSGDFFTEFYEGELSRYLGYAFWGIFGVMWLLALSGQTMGGAFLITIHAIVGLRGLITLAWWSKIIARESPLGPLIYPLFFVFPFIALICGAMSNDTCEKPNRIFMFSVGIIALNWICAIVALVISMHVLGIGM